MLTDMRTNAVLRRIRRLEKRIERQERWIKKVRGFIRNEKKELEQLRFS